MSDRDTADLRGGRIATTEARLEGFFFFWSLTRRRSHTGNAANGGSRAMRSRGQPEAVTVVSDRLVFTPRLKPVA